MQLTPKGILGQTEMGTEKSFLERFCHHALTLSLSLSLSVYVVIACL